VALYLQADWLISHGELLPAVQLGEQIFALAGEQVSLPQALAHRILGMSYLCQGRFLAARQQLEQALALYDALGQPDTLMLIGGDLASTCQVLLGFVLAVSGYLDQAWTHISQSLDRARRIKLPSALGAVLIFACEVAVLRGDLPALRDMAAELLRVGQTEGQRFFWAYGLAAEGCAPAVQTRPGTAQAAANVTLIRRGMQLWESSGVPAGRGMWVIRLAAACLQAGEIEAGLEITRNALTAPAQARMAVGLAQIYRLHGELLLRQEAPDASGAAACFLQAIDIAHQQDARALALRAALSLCRLRQAEGVPAACQTARAQLAEVYAWFTEGFATPDLQAAAALLAGTGVPPPLSPCCAPGADAASRWAMVRSRGSESQTSEVYWGGPAI